MGKISRLSWALRLGGAGMCLAGVLGFFSGFWIQFPSAVEGVKVLSIAIAIGGFLLASGAQFGRAATRRKELEDPGEQEALGGGTPDVHHYVAGRTKDRAPEPSRPGSPPTG